MSKAAKYPNRCDVVIAGSGLSGLVAGALLAKAGKKIVVFPDKETKRERPDGTVGASPSASGTSLFIPQALCFGFDREGLVDRVFNDLGISISLLKRSRDNFEKKEFILQLLFPFHRFTLYHDRKETLDGLKIGFGGRFTAIRDLLNRSDAMDILLYPFLYIDSPRSGLLKGDFLHRMIAWFRYRMKTGSLRGRGAGLFLTDLGCDPSIVEFFEALSLYFYGISVQEISALDLFHLVLYFRREPLAVTTGMEGLKEILVRVIRENKGEFWKEVPSHFSLDGKKVQGFNFKTRESLGCDTLILSPETGGFDRTLQGENILRIYMEIPQQVIPSMMGDFLTLRLDPEKPFAPGNLLYFSLEKRRPKVAQGNGEAPGPGKDEKRGILAQILLEDDFPAETLLQERVRQIVERLIWVVPFARGKVTVLERRLSGPGDGTPDFLPEGLYARARQLSGGQAPLFQYGKTVYFVPPGKSSFLISPYEVKRGWEVAYRYRKERDKSHK